MIKIRRIEYYEVELLRNMTLRQADIDEITTASGMNVWNGLKHSVEMSNEWTKICYEVETDEILMVFGLASAGIVGIPWMVASPNVTKYTKTLIRYGKKVIEEMIMWFPTLVNFVDSRNVIHLRWLEYMGFKFTGVEHLIRGIPFKQFHMERK